MLSCTVLSSLQKVFPDEAPANEGFSGFSVLQGEYGTFQIALHSDAPMHLEIRTDSALPIEVFRVCCIPAKKICNNGDDYYLRKTSGLYPDLLRPCSSVDVDQNYQSLWFEIAVGDTPAGKYPVRVAFLQDGKEEAACTAEVEVIGAKLPEQTLICTHWFHTDCLHTWYDVPVFSEEYWRITENFARAAVKHGINFLLTPLFTPPLDTAIGKERPTVQLVDVTKNGDTYSFGFEKLHRWFEMCNRCGVKYFEMSHLFTQWGAMHAPKIMATVDGKYKQLFGWKTWAASQKYTEFLRAFAAALRPFLESEGVKDRCRFHVSDEPNISRIREYGKRSALIAELFPGYPVTDAMSDLKFYEKGLIKTPIPCVNHAADFYGKVPQLWTYYCCGPDSGNYTNRFFGMPLQRTRVLGYQLYKYEVKGFLQWGLNFWYSQLSDHPINPFETSDSDGAFPAGDAFVLYPGEDGDALISIRFKAFREALQDQRALDLLESLIGREKTVGLLESDGPLTFNQYPQSAAWHLAKREQINRAIQNALQ